MSAQPPPLTEEEKDKAYAAEMIANAKQVNWEDRHKVEPVDITPIVISYLMARDSDSGFAPGKTYVTPKPRRKIRGKYVTKTKIAKDGKSFKLTHNDGSKKTYPIDKQ